MAGICPANGKKGVEEEQTAVCNLKLSRLKNSRKLSVWLPRQVAKWRVNLRFENHFCYCHHESLKDRF